ncbi:MULTISPECIES: homoserine kinase [Olivibacter]|uniref:Homoserine kinase n=1 Tax=Olivibacter jilunii TaxID=985016 RepID=A0ABW6BAD8_9SPHI|nr:homoserine kinase [Olivibacter sp. UJ_SKK_5.1]MDX3912287.1 homoserine kinase [Pseudosphingobacterium sp.]
MELTIEKEPAGKARKEKDRVHVFAPATVANLVCGFDILGLALDEPGDEVIMERSDQPGVKLLKITGDDGRLPLDPAKNTVSACVQMLLKHLNREDVGVEIELHKHMPIGSGLGSSAASTVAGLFAINQLLGQPLTKQELLPFAMKGEELACGHGHADNVAPSLFGGITLIKSYEPLEVVSIPVPKSLYCSVVFPHVDVPTRAARQMIRSKIELKDAVVQWGNIAGLVSGLFMSDYGLIGRSMQDVLIEPVRAILIPEFYEMRQTAMAAGALGFGISGSGPSVFAFADNHPTASDITRQIVQHLQSKGIDSNGYVSAVNQQGPREL